MNQAEIEKLEEELKHSVDSLEKSLKENHIKIDDSFYKARGNKIESVKYYLTNISIICATIIPFSSLVFQIPQDKLPTNIIFWLLSLACFISALGLFIYSFLKLINAERSHYGKLLLYFLSSGSVDFLSFSQKIPNDKLKELVDILDSQENFNREIKNSYKEEDFIDLVKYIKAGSLVFLFGLGFFFLSIISNALFVTLSNSPQTKLK